MFILRFYCKKCELVSSASFHASTLLHALCQINWVGSSRDLMTSVNLLYAHP